MSVDRQRLPLAFSSQKDGNRRMADTVNWVLNNMNLGGAEGALVVYGIAVPGTGTIEADVNVTNFSGHPYAGSNTYITIENNHFPTFNHNSVAYLWQGPRPAEIGLGASRQSVASDYVVTGTADHTLLTKRDLANAHPMSAITGLEQDQQDQDDALAAHLADPDDPHSQYQKKGVGLFLGGTVNNFTLDTSDSKLVNYTLSAQWNWPDDGDINPAAGEFTIPEDGVYNFLANVLGNQGNDNKEEWIELKLDVQNGSSPGRTTVAYLDVPTDKTSVRQLISAWTRPAYAGEVYSLYMWASTGLGTFVMSACTFEAHKVTEADEVAET